MKVNISIVPPQKVGNFANIILSYGEQDVTKVLLHVDYRNMYRFIQLQSGVAFDLFVIACLVYGTDILLPRKTVGYDGWSREIEIIFPVENLDLFENGKTNLEQMLNFLTGDIWKVSFEHKSIESLFYTDKQTRINLDKYKVVNLFSGGMDSLVGAIDQLSSSLDNVCLVSHTDAVFKGAKKDQNMILNVLREKYQNYYYIPTSVYMSKRDVNGNRYVKESTLRSRSFLFLSMALLVADSIDSTIPVYIPENGTISLNYPLTPSRRSTCSTRTTHPHFLNLFQKFLSSIHLGHQVSNKYQFYTKGEMIEQCIDRELFMKTYALSCSCGKRGTRKDIRDNANSKHCGVCMPCIYRRAALHKIQISEEVGTDIFNSQKREIRRIPDMPALMNYIRKDLRLSTIKQKLMVNGSLPLKQLENYASVIMRTRDEIKQWIRDNATEDIKNIFNV